MAEKVSSQLKQNSVRELMEGEGDTYSQDLQADFTHLQSFFHTHTHTHTHTHQHQDAMYPVIWLGSLVQHKGQGTLASKASPYLSDSF